MLRKISENSENLQLWKIMEFDVLENGKLATLPNVQFTLVNAMASKCGSHDSHRHSSCLNCDLLKDMGI